MCFFEKLFPKVWWTLLQMDLLQKLESKTLKVNQLTLHIKKYHTECNSILKVIEHVEVELCFSSQWGLFFQSIRFRNTCTCDDFDTHPLGCETWGTDIEECCIGFIGHCFSLWTELQFFISYWYIHALKWILHTVYVDDKYYKNQYMYKLIGKKIR